MENLEAFRRTLESIHRKNDASQTLNSVTINLAKAKSELSNATKALADLMDIADEGNCKACLVFLTEVRATTIAAYNTIRSAENEIENRSGCQSSAN